MPVEDTFSEMCLTLGVNLAHHELYSEHHVSLHNICFKLRYEMWVYSNSPIKNTVTVMVLWENVNNYFTSYCKK